MQLFTPADQKFTLDAQVMSAARTGHEAIELSATRLLFFEGDTGNTIDEFNHSTDTLALNGSMDGTASSATLLANGKILVLGPDAAGLYSPDAADPAAAFTAFDETSVPGSTALRRSGQTATKISVDKRILVAGGGSYNTAGWTAGASSKITGTGSFASGSTSRKVDVSIQRSSTGLYWNGSAFSAASENFITAAGTTSWNLNFASTNFPADGTYVVRSQATDSNGTQNNPTSATFTIDNPAP